MRVVAIVVIVRPPTNLFGAETNEADDKGSTVSRRSRIPRKQVWGAGSQMSWRLSVAKK